jgi:tetratricopeptide (TPR) repeat protein
MDEVKDLLEKGTVLLNNLNFNILFDDENVIDNPFSLIHPGFLYYIWGKLLNSNEKFQEASELFNKQIQKSLDSQNYADAGEFAILRLKTEGHLDPQSNNLKTSYKKAKKIYENLINLYNDAYYFASLIEVEIFYEKYSGNKINRKKLEELYRKVSFQYYLEAESIIAKDLISIRIMDYFESVNHLNKITFTLTEIDKIQMETITNKMISEILIQIDGLGIWVRKGLFINK